MKLASVSFAMVAAAFAVAQAPESDVPVVRGPSVRVQIDGDGYLRFARQGEVVYAKRAELTVRDGKLAEVSGPTVHPTIVVEGDVTSLSVDLQGRVWTGEGDLRKQLGRLVLAGFPEDVRPVESRGFLLVYGDAQLGEPGSGLYGVVRPWPKEGEGTAEVRVYGIEKIETKTQSEAIKETKPVVEDEVPSPKRKQTEAAPPAIEFLRAGGVQVVLDEWVEMEGGQVRLGNIATIYANAELSERISALVVATVPMIGSERRVDQTLVTGKLKQIGLKTDQIKVVGPAQTVVRQVSQQIAQEEFVTAAMEAASLEFGDVELESERPVAPLYVPLGEKVLSVEGVSRSGSGVSVTVVAYVDGKRINSRTVKLVSKSIPMTLRVGESVTVVVKSGDVFVEVNAKVRSVDRVTGSVTVQTDTGATLVGRLKDNGTVEVIS